MDDFLKISLVTTVSHSQMITSFSHYSTTTNKRKFHGTRMRKGCLHEKYRQRKQRLGEWFVRVTNTNGLRERPLGALFFHGPEKTCGREL